MTRPLDSFNDCNKPHMAAGDFMWGGMAVVVSPNLPKIHVADELVPIMPWWPRRFLYWLFTGRYHPPLRFRAGKKIEEDQALMMQGKLFVSPEGWRQLKQSRDKG